MKFIDENLFDDEQLKEIKKGRKHGLSKKEVLLYADSKFSSFQMKLIRGLLENGISYSKVQEIVSYDLDFYQLLEVIDGLFKGI